MKTKESRRAARSKHDSVMEIFDADGNLIVGVGRLVDFSNVGVCFSSTKVLAIGDRVHARLRLLKEGVLEIAAHIVWMKKKSNTRAYGLEFDTVQKLRS